jgi:hypothetical protein
VGALLKFYAGAATVCGIASWWHQDAEIRDGVIGPDGQPKTQIDNGQLLQDTLFGTALSPLFAWQPFLSGTAVFSTSWLAADREAQAGHNNTAFVDRCLGVAALAGGFRGELAKVQAPISVRPTVVRSSATPEPARVVPNENNFGRAGRVVPAEINVAEQLWQQTWNEAQGMNLKPGRVVEGAIDLETGVSAIRASGTPPASSLALPDQVERFPPGVCGMPRAAQSVIDQTGAADNLILATQGGFRCRNGQWYYVSPCRNCEGIFDLNPNLQRSPLPPGVPPGLPPNTQVPFTPPPEW